MKVDDGAMVERGVGLLFAVEHAKMTVQPCVFSDSSSSER
jgi:hypothetical protein